MAPSVDLELDDQIHVGTQDLKRLGVRLANLACHDLFPKSANCGTLQRGPRPIEAKVMGNVLRVSFQEVNGRLRSHGRVAGFTIHDASGAALPLIYRIRMDPQSPYVLAFHLTGPTPAGATLRYGAGKDPLCNVVDEADMGLPAFQVPIQ